MTLSRYTSQVDAYINPTITEERKLNVAQDGHPEKEPIVRTNFIR